MLNGYKTFIGLGITLLGIFGLGDIISTEEAQDAVNMAIQLVGITLAVIGRIKARKTY